ESPSFDKIIDHGYISHQENVKTFAGPDNELGTQDDIRFVGWPVGKVLKPNKTYHWRVRGYYFDEGDFANKGTVPSKESAGGRSEATGSFTIPPQSGSDSLANVTQITRDSANTGQPTLSKRLDLAYISINPDEGSEIRVAGVQVQRGVPVFDTGREEFTKSVKGSKDQWPQWDVDGEGLFFASDRSSGIPNIWYKRRDARGYTQLTFHDKMARGPTISKDGNRVAYQVANNENSAGWSIWMVGRDGRSATELGSGEQPKFSPDGKKLAFSQLDFNGVKQIWVMDTSGGNRVQITNEACPRHSCIGNQMPVWHPSGQRLVFVSDTKSENHDIWMVELDGARMVQLTNYLGSDTTPEFTPDGRYILFASQRGGDTFHIWMGEFAAN
nr:TolB family protein [Deltaproteobacteria bacterium]